MSITVTVNYNAPDLIKNPSVCTYRNTSEMVAKTKERLDALDIDTTGIIDIDSAIDALQDFVSPTNGTVTVTRKRIFA